jgi:hypothetical protein
MIEVPSEFLNALFMLLIVFASVNRSQNALVPEFMADVRSALSLNN